MYTVQFEHPLMIYNTFSTLIPKSRQKIAHNMMFNLVFKVYSRSYRYSYVTKKIHTLRRNARVEKVNIESKQALTECKAFLTARSSSPALTVTCSQLLICTNWVVFVLTFESTQMRHLWLAIQTLYLDFSNMPCPNNNNYYF